MIDTIEIVLHDINSKNIHLDKPSGYDFKSDFNHQLYDRLLHYQSIYIERQKAFIAEQIHIEPDGTEFKRKSIPKDFVLTKREGIFFDGINGTDLFFRPVRGALNNPSSDYRVQFSANENMDAITFSFSIPKYIYNHNLAQFVPNIESQRYKNNIFTMRNWTTQIEHIRQRLIEFLYTFFDDLSVILNLPDLSNFSLHNVEIKRLDLCYNQYFSEHAMVLDYLNAQRKFYRTKVRSNTIVKDDRDTSFFYRHSKDGFFFKIYSKAEEFEVNDFPKLFKENEQYFESRKADLMPKAKKIFEKHFFETYKKLNGKIEDLIFSYYKTYLPKNENISFCEDLDNILKWKIKALITESNKILRYEMSFTRTYLSTLYKQNLFRNSCKNWKVFKNSYNLITKYNVLLSQGKLNQAKAFKLKNLITTKTFKQYEIYDRSINKKHQFFLLTNNNLKNHENEFIDYKNTIINQNYKIIEMKEASFNDELFKIIFKRFQTEIEYFKVKEFTEIKSILEQIDLYNKNVEKRVLQWKKEFPETFKTLSTTKKRKANLIKLNKPRMKLILDLMDKNLSINQVVQQLGMSKSTYYELLKQLEKFNIHKQTVKHRFDFTHIKTDFSTYYEKFYTQSNYHRKLFHNPYLISYDSLRQYNH